MDRSELLDVKGSTKWNEQLQISVTFCYSRAEILVVERDIVPYFYTK